MLRNTVRIRIRDPVLFSLLDPVLFLTPGSWMGFFQDHISESLVTILGYKCLLLKYCQKAQIFLPCKK